jgi:hypothetical protein
MVDLRDELTHRVADTARHTVSLDRIADRLVDDNTDPGRVRGARVHRTNIVVRKQRMEDDDA